MKKLLLCILNTHFMHCNAMSRTIFTEKLYEVVGINESIEFVSETPNKQILYRICGCMIAFNINERGYIKSIDIKEN